VNAQPPGGSLIEIPTDAQIALQSQIVDLKGKRVDLTLRQVFAYSILALVLVQIAVADVGFFVYADKNHWDIPPVVMSSWLGATVVEVIGIVIVIVTGLFKPDSKT